MKIAFCLVGIVGGTHGKNGIGNDIDFVVCADNYKSNIFVGHDVDVFIHTWSIKHQKPIVRIYQPKASLFEPQIEFDAEGPYGQDRFRSCSRWYSTKKVLELQKTYAETHNITYDYIMVSRFDIMWDKPIDFGQLNKNKFYLSNWNDWAKNRNQKSKKSNASYPNGKMKRYMDLWFIGNQNHMNTLASTYDNIKTIGNHEYDQHKLTFDMIYGNHSDDIVFLYNFGIEYDLYRKKVLGIY